MSIGRDCNICRSQAMAVSSSRMVASSGDQEALVTVAPRSFATEVPTLADLAKVASAHALDEWQVEPLNAHAFGD